MDTVHLFSADRHVLQHWRHGLAGQVRLQVHETWPAMLPEAGLGLVLGVGDARAAFGAHPRFDCGGILANAKLPPPRFRPSCDRPARRMFHGLTLAFLLALGLHLAVQLWLSARQVRSFTSK